MENDDIRMCVNCGAKNKTKAKYCYKCKNNEHKYKCEGWFGSKCDNLTINGIHRCAMHCLQHCANKGTGQRKSPYLHIKEKCCTPSYCQMCRAINFTHYPNCYPCSQELRILKKNHTISLMMMNQNMSKVIQVLECK